MGHSPGRRIAENRRDKFAGKEPAQLHIIVSSKELSEIFIGTSLVEIMAKQPLNGIGHLGRQAAIPNWTRNRLMETDRAADAEVISVFHAVAHFDLLAFDSDVGDPMLAAAIRASSDMQLKVLLLSLIHI